MTTADRPPASAGGSSASAGKRASAGGSPSSAGKRASAGLVLAAGEGRRFGRPKALVEVDGERFVDRAVRLLAAGGCAPLVVVSGAVPVDMPPEVVIEGVRGRSADGSGSARHVAAVQVVHNANWAEGMGSSLRAGLQALDADQPDAVVVALVDQPWLGPEAIKRLLAARAGGASVAVATYGGRRGNPVLLGREVWAEVADLAEADVGARAFMAAHPELVTAVPCDDTGRPDDVDRPEDLPGIDPAP